MRAGRSRVRVRPGRIFIYFLDTFERATCLRRQRQSSVCLSVCLFLFFLCPVRVRTRTIYVTRPLTEGRAGPVAVYRRLRTRISF